MQMLCVTSYMCVRGLLQVTARHLLVGSLFGAALSEPPSV